MTKIIDFFPEGDTPREAQKYTLNEVERLWDSHDVLVLQVDVGGGKSHILQTIAKWRADSEESSATLTPRVTLQDQYANSFPEVTVLKGKGRYKCKDDTFRNCLEKHEVCLEYCSGCKYQKDRESASGATNSVFSIHSYLMLRERKDNLLCDEAHSLFSIMSDQSTVKLWQSKVKYPNGLKDYGDVITWLEKAIDVYDAEKADLLEHIALLRESNASNAQLIPWVTGLKEVEQSLKKYSRVLHGIRHRPTDFFIEHVEEEYNGRLAKALKIRPTTLEDSMGWLWPTQTKKIVLASATLSEKDIEMLGLAKRRVAWVKAPEVIPAEDRPIVILPVGNMSYKYQDKAIPKIADKILELQAQHAGTKGIVHAPYAVALKLKKLLGGKAGFIWHDQQNKEVKLAEFQRAEPGTVFVASGMAEGIDLAGPEYGYQIITKTPWPSKSDRLIEYWYENNMEWVSWLVARDIIQACGRVNRYPGDVATTYILDQMMGNPKKNRRGFLKQFNNLFPESFMERIQ